MLNRSAVAASMTPRATSTVTYSLKSTFAGRPRPKAANSASRSSSSFDAPTIDVMHATPDCAVEIVSFWPGAAPKTIDHPRVHPLPGSNVHFAISRVANHAKSSTFCISAALRELSCESPHNFASLRHWKSRERSQG